MTGASSTAKAAQAVEATTPILTVSDGIATIRINRPAVANRLEPADLAALLKYFAQIEADPSVRVLVLTGSGRLPSRPKAPFWTRCEATGPRFTEISCP